MSEAFTLRGMTGEHLERDITQIIIGIVLWSVETACRL